MHKCYDVIIIGGGVVGSSIARELARYHVTVGVLEKEEDVCCGNSGRNTGMLHAGFLYEPGTMKAKFSVEGNLNFDEVAKELDVPFKRTGKLSVGFTEKQRDLIIHLKEQGEKNGVPGLTIIDRDGIRKIEPNGSGEFALYSPTSGIMCPYLYNIALAENAKNNGVDYFFEHKVITVNIKTINECEIITNKDKFNSRWVINSCGLNAPKVAAMLGSPGHIYEKVKGEYILLDKHAGQYFHIPIYPLPDEKGLIDVHVTPTIDGNVLVGPTCDEIVKSNDFRTSQKELSIIMQNGPRLFSEMRREWYIRSFSGIFPRLIDPKTNIEQDFLIEHKLETPNIINLLGMHSPALTSATPIGKYVADIIAKKEGLAKNERFDPYRKGIKRFAEQDIETQRKMIEENPDYGEIICRCESVTKAEILEALNNLLGVTNVNGIKYRTRATMGRCQGGYCETRIASIIQEELGEKKTEVRLSNSESYMFTGEVRESCK